MKIRKVGAEFFHADRRTDRRDEANSRFSLFWDGFLKKSESGMTVFASNVDT
jgi:hypothetical protein